MPVTTATAAPPSLLFAATTDPTKSVGGWGGIGYALRAGLDARLGPTLPIDCSDIRPSAVSRHLNKALRVARLPRPFVEFSDGRLNAIARRVHDRAAAHPGTPLFFAGGINFAYCRPVGVPYFVYCDSSIHTFARDYIPRAGLSRRALDRVDRLEARFLAGAAAVFLSSQWLADRIVEDYRVDPAKLRFAGVGPGPGVAFPEPTDPPTYEPYLLFIATDVERKRVDLAVEAVRAARRLGAGTLTLKVVGQRPADEFLREEFVEYLGWLSPRDPVQRQTFSRLFSSCLAHFLPTRADFTPLAIIEAAIFRKPTVATAVGGIPDMIRHDATGLLFPADASPDAVARLLVPLAADPARAASLGQAAYDLYRSFWNWDSTLDRIVDVMASHLPAERDTSRRS